MGIMDFLQYINEPKFKGVITRRTTPQLLGPGGPYDKCKELFVPVCTKVKWQEKKSKWVFPSGAEIFLRHFEAEKNKDDFQGWELSHVLVDEGQQYEEDMILYLMSRLRNPHCPVKPKIKITCNPLKESYLRKWLDWWIGEDGLPIKERDGKLRWAIRIDNQWKWADSREECIRLYGKPDLDINHPRQAKPISFTFLPATVHDNPVLMELQPEYVSWLEGLNGVERSRLLDGNWDITAESAGYWKSEWVDIVETPPLNVVNTVRAWDISGQLPSDVNPNPDYTCGVRVSKTKDGHYYIEDVVRDRRRHGGVLDLIKEVAKDDGDNVAIIIPRDPGAAGLAYASSILKELAEYGYYARMKATNQSKVTRFAPFATASEGHWVHIVKGAWNDAFIAELERFDGSRNVKDDQVDAVSDAFIALNNRVTIPNFSIPDMSQANPFRF